MSERESMQYDVVIVGAGPAGLSAAIRLKQMSREQDHEISVCVLEKGSEIGAHILSGAVLEPRALNELIPDWREKGAPLTTPVTEDRFFMFTKRTSIQFPTWMLPSDLHNDGNYIISLGNLCRWLGQQAEALGVDIFPGFAASELLFNTNGSIKGVATGDMGIGRDGEKTMRFSPGVELHAKYRQLFVPQPHDQTVFGLRHHFQTIGAGCPVDNQTVIARRLEGRGQALENPTALVANMAELAVHDRWRLDDLAAERLADRLVSQANPEQRDPGLRGGVHRVQADPRLFRIAGPG